MNFVNSIRWWSFTMHYLMSSKNSNQYWWSLSNYHRISCHSASVSSLYWFGTGEPNRILQNLSSVVWNLFPVHRFFHFPIFVYVLLWFKTFPTSGWLQISCCHKPLMVGSLCLQDKSTHEQTQIITMYQSHQKVPAYLYITRIQVWWTINPLLDEKMVEVSCSY